MPAYRHLIVASGKKEGSRGVTEDSFAISRFVTDMVRQLTEPATRDFNYDQVDGATVGAEAIASMVQTPPMMAARRVIRIDDAQALPKDTLSTLIAEIDNLISSNADDVFLILVYGAAKYPPKAILDRAGTLREFGVLKVHEAERWLTAHLREVHGRGIEPRAATMLVGALAGDGNTTGVSTGAMVMEAEKIALAIEDPRITREHVETLSGHRAGTVYDLCDAMGRRDFGRADEILIALMNVPEWSGVRIVITLSHHLVDLLRLCTEADGYAVDTRTIAPWKRKQLGDQVSRWRASELRSALNHLSRTDLDLKSGSNELNALRFFFLLLATIEP